jgi:DNA-binding NarL/FixJ family response regulator
MARGKSAGLPAQAEKIRVITVAENGMVAFLLRDVLNRFPGCEVIHSVTTCEDAISNASASPADVAVINQNLEGESLKGLQLARRFLSACPGTRCVIVVDSPAREVIVEAFQSGARGIFRQGEEIEGLWDCISQVHQGKIHASQADISAIVETLVQSPPVRLLNTHGKAMLTNQEQAVARWVVEGYSNREIAEKLKLSEHTVKNYLFRIFDRLGVSNRTELTLYVLGRRTELSEPEPTTASEEVPSNGSPLSSCFKDAQAGSPTAQFRLAEMYHRGQGVPKDSVASYMWLTLAEKNATSVSAAATVIKHGLAAKMANVDIATAESRAKKWWDKHLERRGENQQAASSEPKLPFAQSVSPKEEAYDDGALPLPVTATA